MFNAETVQKLIETAQTERKKVVDNLLNIAQRKKELEAAINQLDGALRGYQIVLETLNAAETPLEKD
jgi:hypothetical protein